MQKVPMTTDGHARIKEELNHLKSVARPRIIQAIAEARKHGDLSENAEYHAAKEQQGMTEARVKVLEGQLSRATVINVAELSGDTVTFGATVKVLDEDTEEQKQFQIVGELEADATNGKISITSPIARALIGKEVGDSIELNTPGGEKYYEILEISFI